MTVTEQRPMSNSHRRRRAVVGVAVFLLAAVAGLVGVEAAASASRGHLRHPRRRQQRQPCKTLARDTCKQDERCRWRSRKKKCKRAQGQGGGAGAQAACRAGADGRGAGCGGRAYCKLAPGACAALAPAELGDGKCVGTGVVCADKDAPVCGCDGADYAHQCAARAAGTSIASWGACPRPADIVEAPLVLVCPDGEESVPDTFCGRGPNRADCGSDEYCFVDPADRFAVCCPGSGEKEPLPVTTDPARACLAGADGFSVDDCGRGSFCQLAAGACAGLASSQMAGGRCEAKVELCTKNLDPVCGCDDATYPNACMARAAGMSVAFEGQCVEPPKTMPTLPTTTTTAKPPREPDQPDLQAVACAAGADGQSQDNCGEGRFCRLVPGACRALLAAEKEGGLCEVTPFMCTEELEQVCGCDGETYDNQCKASASGMSVAGRGRCAQEEVIEGVKHEDDEKEEEEETELQSDCEVASNGRDDTSCSKDKFCRLEAGACSNLAVAEKGRGRCIVAAGSCPTHMQQVCGCNGFTYSNACKAGAARISVAHEGACDTKDKDNEEEIEELQQQIEEEEEEEPELQSDCEVASNGRGDTSCDKEQFCRLEVEACSNLALIDKGRGRCVTPHGMCPMHMQPVCGCNGVTYSNACKAGTARMSVAHEGACDTKETEGGGAGRDPEPSISDIVEGPSSGSTDDGCFSGAKCSAAGSVCTEGEETCCGETYDSFRCNCQDMGGGNLEYMCFFTDACFSRQCPEVKEEPHVEIHVDQGVDWKTIAEGSSSGSEGDVCAPLAKCGAAGSVCTSGQETCCGETHDSLHCDCQDMGGGNLEYMCVATDACNNRLCSEDKREEPPADEYFGQTVDWDTCLDEDQCFVDGACTDVAACDGDPCATARCGDGASCEVDRCASCLAICTRGARVVAVDNDLVTYYPPV